LIRRGARKRLALLQPKRLIELALLDRNSAMLRADVRIDAIWVLEELDLR
jgi:hypothetical protein